MLPSEPAALDSLLDRALGAESPPVPFPPRPPEAAPHPPRRRLGRLLAAGVVAVLAAGVAVTTVVDSGSSEAGPVATPQPSSPVTTRVATTTTPVAVETRDGVHVELREPSDLERAYRAVAPDDGVAAVGPSTCANGAPEERAWSSPSAPEVIAGRFRCTFVDGRAAMWWTEEASGVLAHATAPHDDLAALFAWWLAQTDL